MDKKPNASLPGGADNSTRKKAVLNPRDRSPAPGESAAAWAEGVQHPLTIDQRPVACRRGKHVFADGACVNCDVLPPYPGGVWEPKGPPPPGRPHSYDSDERLRMGCMGLALFVLVVGVALIAIGLSSGFEVLGDASLQ